MLSHFIRTKVIFKTTITRGIKLFNHTMKLCERLIEGILRKDVRIMENQLDFMLARLTVEAIHLICKLLKLGIEKRTSTWCSLT